MLHPVPDSPLRNRLLEVMGMQRVLFEALCALPPSSSVDLAWLHTQWATKAPEGWRKRFWENDSGKRAAWCRTIAGAHTSIKSELLAIMAEQLRFAELYDDPPTLRLTIHSWKASQTATGTLLERLLVMSAARSLFESFYAPLFYKSEGYPNADGSMFHKDQFVGKPPKVCPYSDNKVQDVKLDHFLPKETFPFLSCHPDNLIPCSTDPNSVGRKGNRPPLDPDEPEQAEEWFHPKIRPAIGRFTLTFDSASSDGPLVQFVANDAADQLRLDNMASMFGLIEFWSRDLNDELQLIASEIADEIRNEGFQPCTELVRYKLERCIARKRGRIGHDALAIVHSAFYEHVLKTPTFFAQVERTCAGGS